VHQDANAEAFGPQLPKTSELLQLLASANNRVEQMTGRLAMCKSGLERYGTDSSKLMIYTRFSSYNQFTGFFHWMQPIAQQMAYPYSAAKPGLSLGGTMLLALYDEPFLTLCRLHAGLLEQDLADRFNCSVSTVSRISLASINLLYVVLGSIHIWPSSEATDKHMPAGMKASYPKVRVKIDCTEIFTQKPSSLLANSQLYS